MYLNILLFKRVFSRTPPPKKKENKIKTKMGQNILKIHDHCIACIIHRDFQTLKILNIGRCRPRIYE